jgi:hypothetical protein
MIRKHDFTTAELPPTARPRVRLPGSAAAAEVFPGWGPGIGR